MKGWPVPWAIAACLAAPVAFTQEPSPSPTPSPGPVLTADGEAGFSISSADGAYQLAFGATVQLDGRFYPGDESDDFTDTLEIRRLRPYIEGRVAKRYSFELVPDFGEGNAVLEDGYADAAWTSGFRTRVGRFKTPVGFERLASDSTLFFPERSLAQNVVPSRDLGLMIHGLLAQDRVMYQVGIFNGTPDRRSEDEDSNDAKDVAGRILVKPFPGKWAGVTVGVGASWGNQEGDLPTYQTPGQQTFLRYADGAVADGTRVRLAPQLSFYRGPVRGMAEFVRSAQDVTREDVSARVANTAFQATVAWILTGEHAKFGSPKPGRPFLEEGGRGAWEIALRYHGLDVDDAMFGSGFADPDGVPRRARAFGVALNWYLNVHVRVAVDYENTRYRGGAPAGADRSIEHSILSRFQFVF